MKYALVKNGEAIEADSLIDLVILTGRFEFDVKNPDNGVLYFRGNPDSITYGKSYNAYEKTQEMAKRAVVILERNGWTLYKG